VVDSTDVVDDVELVIDVVNEVSEETLEEAEVWDVSVERDVVDSVVVTEVSVVDCVDVLVDAELLMLSVVEESIDDVVTDDSIEEVTMEEVGISVDVATDVVAEARVDSVGAVENRVSVEI